MQKTKMIQKTNSHFRKPKTDTTKQHIFSEHLKKMQWHFRKCVFSAIPQCP